VGGRRGPGKNGQGRCVTGGEGAGFESVTVNEGGTGIGGKGKTMRKQEESWNGRLLSGRSYVGIPLSPPSSHLTPLSSNRKKKGCLKISSSLSQDISALGIKDSNVYILEEHAEVQHLTYAKRRRRKKGSFKSKPHPKKLRSKPL